MSNTEAVEDKQELEVKQRLELCLIVRGEDPVLINRFANVDEFIIYTIFNTIYEIRDC